MYDIGLRRFWLDFIVDVNMVTAVCISSTDVMFGLSGIACFSQCL
jgi:hypothetical protein